jgi:hypothetical protein
VFLGTFCQICRRKAGIGCVGRILVLDRRSTIGFGCEFGSIAFVSTNAFSIAVSIENQDFIIFVELTVLVGSKLQLL